MSILNRPSDGLLSVMLAVRRAIAAFGAMDEAKVIALCAPPSVVSEPDMIRKTITRWKQIGFFEDRDGKLDLAPSFASIALDDLRSLRSELLRLVLSQENNPWLSSDGTESKAGDWTRAAAWVLAQDLYSFPTDYAGVEALQEHQAVEPRVFANDTRWHGFVEWSAFLGIAWNWKSRTGTMFEPGFAVEAVLPSVLRSAEQMSMPDFLPRLAAVFPVIDSGIYADIVQQGLRRPWRTPRPDHVSPCLSAALARLEAGGVVRMETRSDAPQVWLLGQSGRERRQVSHIIRTGGE